MVRGDENDSLPTEQDLADLAEMDAFEEAHSDWHFAYSPDGRFVCHMIGN